MSDVSPVTATVGSPIEWYKLEVMRDVINVKESWENHSKLDSRGVQSDLGVIHARTQSLFNSLYPYLKRKLDAKVFDDMKRNLFTLKFLQEDVLREIFWTIQTQLDQDQIIKMDNRKSYDGTRAEQENENFYL